MLLTAKPTSSSASSFGADTPTRKAFLPIIKNTHTTEHNTHASVVDGNFSNISFQLAAVKPLSVSGG